MKKKRNPLRFYLVFVATMGIMAGLHAYFHFDVPPYKVVEQPVVEEVIVQNDEVEYVDDETEYVVDETAEVEMFEDDDVDAPMLHRTGSRMWSYQECFPDSQATQLSAAILNGISPTQSRDELTTMLQRHQLVDISNSPFYVVDELHHSMPYLVPKAQHLLNTIAINFLDSLQRKGLPLHKPIVSSVLRTTEDVEKLQHGNKNATTNSCHCYGTTIDITYHRFIPCDTRTHQPTRYDDDLKFVLAEVLNDLRLQDRCYVKYEQKQACFHLTVR